LWGRGQAAIPAIPTAAIPTKSDSTAGRVGSVHDFGACMGVHYCEHCLIQRPINRSLVWSHTRKN